MVLSIALLSSAFIVGPALSTDNNFPYYIPPDSTPIIADSAWNRPYVGVFGGVSSSKRDYEITNLGVSLLTANFTSGGLEFGLRGGYDHVEGQFLIGALAEFAVSNDRAAASATVPLLGLGSLESRLDSLGALRIRAGFLPTENLALYVHGGGALGNVSHWANGAKIPGLKEDLRVGYVVGVGTEYAILPNVSLNTDYSYTNFGKFELENIAGLTTTEVVEAHRLTSGVNFRF